MADPNLHPQRPDLDSRERIHMFVDAFYRRMLQDPELAPIFLEVAEIDLDRHLPLIRAYWEKLLLGEKGYKRHTMNIHRDLDAERRLRRRDFERWLALFQLTVDSLFAGPHADRAKQTAQRIATNMHAALNPDTPAQDIQPADEIGPRL